MEWVKMGTTGDRNTIEIVMIEIVIQVINAVYVDKITSIERKSVPAIEMFKRSPQQHFVIVSGLRNWEVELSSVEIWVAEWDLCFPH